MKFVCARTMPPETLSFLEPAGTEPEDWESVLIDRTLQGRYDAFGDLVQPHLALLNRYAQARLRNPWEAEDAVQQSVLRAFRHLSKFRRQASFKTWLSAIVWNEVSLIRRRQVSHSRETIWGYVTAKLTDLSGSPHMLFQRRQELDRLRGAVAALPEKYRLVIELRDLSELSVGETARRLAITTATVKTRHHRARKLLVRSFVRRPV
ncbi:MAG TPA: sigma-70 family RNA polymerase sigma factor [Bryobacteraceae bacterium]|jgi:RNA polymerase sigma-70 factor (ECF subfamily)